MRSTLLLSFIHAEQPMRTGTLSIAILLVCYSLAGGAAADVRQVLQLVDYVGVDYSRAIHEGAVADTAEYAEMRDFTGAIRDQIAAMSPPPRALLAQADALVELVDAKAAPERVATSARALRATLLDNYDVLPLPARPPDMARAAHLYAQNCAACHGAEGAGDGPVAATLTPPPTDFTDRGRAVQRSLFGLYNTITLGVNGTAMPAFSGLDEADRWALAFHVGGLFAGASRMAQDNGPPATSLDPQTMLTTAPQDWQPGGVGAAAWARLHPEAWLGRREAPLEIAVRLVHDSASAYRDGDRAAAREAAIGAYLDGFELTEAALGNLAPELVRSIEGAMSQLRAVIAEQASPTRVQAQADTVLALLERAGALLQQASLSPDVAFLSALAILLREGLEALLLVGALAAFLVRTGRGGVMRYLHFGWVAAIAAGIGTWYLSGSLFAITGAAREMTEGVTALIAATVLFYVGFWMHDKLSAARWNEFLRTRVEAALEHRTLWGIAFIAFIAVYREMFETVLFYQALWTQVDAGGRGAVIGGVVLAAVALAGLGWAMLRFGVRLPLRQFFGVSSVLMFGLAVVFAGKGVAALQEAGRLPQTLVDLPRVDMLGIYPNVQGLALQGVLTVLALVLWLRNRRALSP